MENKMYKIGQEFIYDKVIKIILKYSDKPDIKNIQRENLLKIDRNNNELSLYLYVENIGNEIHESIPSRYFVAYPYKEYLRDNVGYCKADEEKERRFIRDVSFPGFENYKDKDKLNPGEKCEGWIAATVDPDWKIEDIAIDFETEESGEPKRVHFTWNFNDI